jgi:hypothetical protein
LEVKGIEVVKETKELEELAREFGDGEDGYSRYTKDDSISVSLCQVNSGE